MEYDTVSCAGTNTNELLNIQMSSWYNEMAVPDSENRLIEDDTHLGF